MRSHEVSLGHLRDGVPEDEGGVAARLGHVDLPVLGHVVLAEGHLDMRSHEVTIGHVRSHYPGCR